MKKLTIIIPTYNSQQYIEKCIVSIINQTYTNLEIIIIDDNSKDRTYDICKKIQKKDTRIKLMKNSENKGVSTTRNKGISISTGEYITFVDADDYIEKNMYEKLINKLEEEDVDIAMCNFFSEEKNRDIRDNIKNKDMIFSDNEMLKYIFLSDYFCGFAWNKIYKSDIIKNNKLNFNDNIFICEDLLFNCQYISKIKRGFYTTNKMYHYVQRNNSSYNNTYSERWETVIQAYEKMKLYIKEEGLKNFQYSYLYSLLNLKEKLYIEKHKKKEMLYDINRKIKVNIVGIKKNKDLSLKLKIKIYIKLYMMKFFVILKKIKFIIIKSDK